MATLQELKLEFSNIISAAARYTILKYSTSRTYMEKKTLNDGNEIQATWNDLLMKNKSWKNAFNTLIWNDLCIFSKNETEILYSIYAIYISH